MGGTVSISKSLFYILHFFLKYCVASCASVVDSGLFLVKNIFSQADCLAPVHSGVALESKGGRV